MEQVKAIVAYSPKKEEVGTVKMMDLAAFSAAAREGRVRRYDPETDGPERTLGDTPQPVPAPEPAPPASPAAGGTVVEPGPGDPVVEPVPPAEAPVDADKTKPPTTSAGGKRTGGS